MGDDINRASHRTRSDVQNILVVVEHCIKPYNTDSCRLLGPHVPATNRPDDGPQMVPTRRQARHCPPHPRPRTFHLWNTDANPAPGVPVLFVVGVRVGECHVHFDVT